MKFTKLVPNIFYTDISTGLKLFVDCLDFKITYNDLHSEHPFCVVQNGNLKIHLIQDAELVDKNRPEIRLETHEIDDIFMKVRAYFPELLHPEAGQVMHKSWRTKEFVLRDPSGVCIIIQQWDNNYIDVLQDSEEMEEQPLRRQSA